jgi:hydroxymethylpyrimidine/phosphomethylpyrimidine kinase
VSRSDQPVKVLTIGGSDSGGAAGIQADLKTLTILGVYGMSVLTVVTAQNSLNVIDVQPMPSELVASQLDAVLSDYGAQAVKTGFIGRVDLIEVIARKVDAFSLSNVVVDPVLVDHKGESMFPKQVTKAYIDYLFPLANLVTPNVREAELLAGVPIAESGSVVLAAEQLIAMGCQRALITGKRDGDEVVDTYHDGKSVVEFRSRWINSSNRHGSGDTLSAAICAFLSLNFQYVDAIQEARVFTAAAIMGAKEWRLGEGHGPVNHMGNRRVTEQKTP